jgi:glycine oxidase
MAGQGIETTPSVLGRRRTAGPSDTACDALPASADVAVVGGGLIGLSIAWRLARAGRRVVVVEAGRVGAGASGAATGMLAAGAEHEPGGEALMPFARWSQRLWPAFRDELEAASGLSLDYRGEGTLVVAIGRDEVERLRFRREQLAREGVAAAWLSGAEVRAREPGLRPSVTAGMFCPEDHQVDPARVVAALAAALRAAGGAIVAGTPATGLLRAAGRVAGVETPAGTVRAPVVVLATGAEAARGALVPELALPVRPLKGQSLVLRTSARSGGLAHVVWTEQVHLAPKADGRLIVGATMEEAGFDAEVTAGGLLALLDGARRALPGVEEMVLEGVWTGFRPTSDDDAPFLGETGHDGLLVANGHHRNGYLLAPATAEALAGLVLEGRMPDVAAPFTLARFRANARVPWERTDAA